jgi:hypothetical protein
MTRREIRREFARRFWRAVERHEANIGRCATRTRMMVVRWGGEVGAAKRMAAQRYTSSGFRSLGARGSVERLMLRQPFRVLFDAADLANARRPKLRRRRWGE